MDSGGQGITRTPSSPRFYNPREGLVIKSLATPGQFLTEVASFYSQSPRSFNSFSSAARSHISKLGPVVAAAR